MIILIALRRALLAVLLLSLVATPPLRAHDVKDPVCRMTIDTDTTPFQQTVDGKTYYFCSLRCEKIFESSPKHYIDLYNLLAADRGAGYTAILKTSDAVPGKPVDIAITIYNNSNHRLVRDFQVVHEELLHLVMVRSDQSWFEHQHPYLASDGVFRIRWTFPRAGLYYLYADFTPVGGDNQIDRMLLQVGPGRAHPVPAPLVPEAVGTKRVGDLRVTPSLRPNQFIVGQQTLVTYAFADAAGRPITNLQPFIGAMGHIFAVSADGLHVVHTHALHGVAPGSYAATMLAVMQASSNLVVTPDEVTEHGPKLSFKLTLPTAGTYKIWAQFMRHNRVITVAYTVRGRDIDSAAQGSIAAVRQYLGSVTTRRWTTTTAKNLLTNEVLRGAQVFGQWLNDTNRS